MNRSIFCLLLFLAYFSCLAESASILALFSSLSYSDHAVFRGLVSQLAQKGHNVVMMTAYPGHFTYPDVENIVELDVGQESAAFWNEWLKLMTNTDDYYTRLRAINELNIRLTIAQIQSKQMQSLLINPNLKFDLVITEADVPILYAAAEKYQCPHIAITTSSGKIHQYEAKGNPVHPILYPDVNALNYGNLTHWGKIVELNRHIQTKLEYYNNYLPYCEIAAKKLFGLKKDLLEVEKDIDLLFVAANPLLIGNRPTVPAIIYTDRLHLRPGFSLPQNLQATLDAAKKGVIYFSLGAVQESEALAPRLLKTLSEAFRELPFTVLWKIGNTTAFDKPDNVITGAWFPQQEVLAHPNVKAFLTNGGPRSLEEALFYEVPIIGLPIVRSRKVFMKEITKHGAGEIVDPYTFDKDELKATISLVAANEQYKRAMSKLKAKVVNEYISGPDNAVWWVDYVLRNGGARHLRAATVGMSSFSYFLLDVVGILLVGSLVVLLVSYFLLRWVIKRLRVKFLRRGETGGKFKAL
ncbi:UDP-glucosyltransferase 2-like [Pectinophora gossypiella]|uniref:UDP-glucuronosyltransferase n=1 Tax=Pectinophora gossypiella TaxID=13191 RepID=A0A1E1WQJ5_PECGO|nr:UDP-glucosyltransferase 2-like [Pectinophora gossypiella]